LSITDRKTLAGVAEVGAGFEEDAEVDPEAAVEVGDEAGVDGLIWACCLAHILVQ